MSDAYHDPSWAFWSLWVNKRMGMEVVSIVHISFLSSVECSPMQMHASPDRCSQLLPFPFCSFFWQFIYSKCNISHFIISLALHLPSYLFLPFEVENKVCGYQHSVVILDCNTRLSSSTWQRVGFWDWITSFFERIDQSSLLAKGLSLLLDSLNSQQVFQVS